MLESAGAFCWVLEELLTGLPVTQEGFSQAMLGLVVLNESSSFEASEGGVHGGLDGCLGGDLQ
jgi:hypothetical protein